MYLEAQGAALGICVLNASACNLACAILQFVSFGVVGNFERLLVIII